MKIELNHDACIGCGMCVNTDEKNFDYDGNGYVIVKNNNISDETIEAEKYCPVGAITIKQENKEN